MWRPAASISRATVAMTALVALALPRPLGAQAIEDDSQRLQSVLDLEREGYQPFQIKVGGLLLSPELDVSSLFDSNVYAARVDRQSDLVMRVQPRLTIASDEGLIQFQGQLSGEVRRYVSTPRENSVSYGAAGTVIADITNGIKMTAAGSYRRAVENRSDPEVRQNPLTGPPLFDVANGELTLRGGRGNFGISIKGLAEKYNFTSRLNDDRDFASYRGTVRLLYRVSPTINGFVQGYANKRDFRIGAPVSGASRDGVTIGALAGVLIDPGGKLRGDIGLGVFRYHPASSLFQSFSGFALDGSLIYAIRARTALILDVFQGDVATVRNGASGRIDSRMRLGVQQEIRHNLIADAAIRLRQTRYRGASDKLTTYGADMNVEYLIDHHFSLALVVQLTKRTSRSAFDSFERARAGLKLSFRY